MSQIVPQDVAVEEGDGDVVMLHDAAARSPVALPTNALSVVVSQAVDVHNGNNTNNNCNHGDFGASTIVERSVRLPPVFMRMPNTAFGIPMGLGGHAIMWKNMMEATYIERMTLNTMDILNCLSWYTCLITAGFISLCYVYKMCTSFGLVKAEWLNETRTHFYNCPNLIFLMLLISLPEHINASARSLRVMWGLSFCYQTLMTYYIYKAWMFSPSRNITEAKPQFLLSTTGWFLLSVLGEICDLRDEWGIGLSTMCFGAGFLLYIDLIIFIFAQLHENTGMKGSPSMFLLIAVPSIGVVSLVMMEILPFAEMLLGWVLVLLVLLFGIGPRLLKAPSVMGEYWAYVFPLASASSACIRYAGIMQTKSTETLAILMICIALASVFIVIGKMCYHMMQCLRKVEQWRDPLFEFGRYREKTQIQLPGATVHWGVHVKRCRDIPTD